ncbi:MAG: hypothetical protein K9H61_07925 [Bacteroidia bacterium]|nr:hypothetical protein [Bacteroidia bacterium]MCF8427653.1 hypothetical protein [Bacteroidia bacterium]MCF8446909.1 hypothetical protein [Bacteroidia bacterium]
MQETSFNLFQFNINEPMTVLTNLVMSIYCFYFYSKLGSNHKLGYYWRLFFLYMAISTLVGALTHGLKNHFSSNEFYYIWLFMNLASIPASYFLLQANIQLSKWDEVTKKKLSIASAIVTLLLAIMVISVNQFLLIKVNAGLIILITLITHFQTYKKGIKGSGWIVFGFAFSSLSILVHTMQFSLHTYFNYKDISHVIMNIGLYIIFLGAILKSQPKIEA